MAPQPPIREQERGNWEFFLALPEMDRRELNIDQVKGSAAPAAAVRVLRRLRRLRRDALRQAAHPALRRPGRHRQRHRLLVDLRRQPADHALRRRTRDGRGPAWSNSLFEDNAEFGLGFRLAVDKQNAVRQRAGRSSSRPARATSWSTALARAPTRSTEAGIAEQRERVGALKQKLAGDQARREAHDLLRRRRHLVKKSVWIVGGDGWAYDIGYGGLDHVLASGRNVNVLVLDTEVYSNTGGQMSKATPARRGGQVRRRRQAAPQEGPGHDGHDLRQRLRGAGGHGRQRRADRARRSSRPRPTTGRRSSSPTATASPTAST